MSYFVLMTDSSTDLPKAFYEENDVELIPIRYVLDGVEYKDDAGVSMEHERFYEKMRAGSMSSTSLINREEYTQAFEKFLSEGKDVLYISISSGISGSYQSAVGAAEELSEKYPDRKLYVCDGLCASMGGAVLMHYAQKMRAAGKSIDEVRDWVEENKLRVIHLFTVDDLMFLKRSGRISSSAAVLGSLMGVKPMLDVDANGKLRACKKMRGRRGALEGLVNWVEEFIESDEIEVLAISHADCEQDAMTLLEKMKEKYKIKEVLINFIGPVIGSHSGPDTIAIFFMGRKRT
ncbi:MAG: DegV family protein [Clostridiales bacterium]|nr:DegV family protein [Clostridiales bacterium]